MDEINKKSSIISEKKYTRTYRIFYEIDDDDVRDELISAKVCSIHSNKKIIDQLPCLSPLPVGAFLRKCCRQYPQYIDKNGICGVFFHILCIRKYEDEQFKSNVCSDCFFPNNHVNTYLMYDDISSSILQCQCDCTARGPSPFLKMNGTITNCAKLPKFFL